ncbi:MAG: NifB/NifX family molybdenum-iron cluster-binding protein [Bacilli bacterium]|nr:NifB/NifX family molybdenum-iron cluster-binding protein [Bacilli bacterium]
MKVAVAVSDNQVAQHFGFCQLFRIYTIDNGKVVSKEDIANPGHKPGFLPVFLNNHGVEVIIAGGMGGSAVDLFNENKIEVIIGISGDTDTAINNYIAGKLVSTGSVCHEHTMHKE